MARDQRPNPPAQPSTTTSAPAVVNTSAPGAVEYVTPNTYPGQVCHERKCRGARVFALKTILVFDFTSGIHCKTVSAPNGTYSRAANWLTCIILASQRVTA